VKASPTVTPDAALTFIRQHGVVLVSAHGPVPKLIEAIAGEPINGSWWSHARSREIYAILEEITHSPDVLVCRVINGNITLVHRRLWPALVRVAHRFSAGQLAQVLEEHTPSGRHVTHERPFPQWVPPEVLAMAKDLNEADALETLGAWTSAPNRAPRVSRARRKASSSPSRS
jgi:hypothetical protein